MPSGTATLGTSHVLWWSEMKLLKALAWPVTALIELCYNLVMTWTGHEEELDARYGANRRPD